MSHAIRIHQAGGSEVLQWDSIEVGKPGAGQVRLKQAACGLNYIDIYMRDGVYPIAEIPCGVGHGSGGCG